MYLKALIFCSFMLACKSQKSSNVVTENQQSFEILLQDSHSNMEVAITKEISSQQELQQLFSRINSTRKPGFAIPKIDFSKHRIGFVNLGQKNTGGYSVTVDQIAEETSDIRVILKTTEPGMMATSVITTPFVLFSTENRNKPLVFDFVND